MGRLLVCDDDEAAVVDFLLIPDVDEAVYR